MWTEIYAEDIGVTHVEGMEFIWPIGEDVSEGRARQVQEQLVQQNVWEANLEQMKLNAEEMQQNMRERERAVDKLEDAGYDRDDIPL